MKLSEKQMIFFENVCTLGLRAVSLGYDGLTLGEGYRPPEMAAIYAKKGIGIKNSVHTVKLAVDLQAFSNGEYLDDTDAYRPLGDYWKTLHPLNRWGGDFKTNPDGCHFSMEHEGVK